jgi:hypothetical protein
MPPRSDPIAGSRSNREQRTGTGIENDLLGHRRVAIRRISLVVALLADVDVELRLREQAFAFARDEVVVEIDLLEVRERLLVALVDLQSLVAEGAHAVADRA